MTERREADPLRLLLLVMSGAYFIYRYVVETARPGMSSSQGWFSYFDQGSYLVIAHDLSHFVLPTSHFLFGLGYPVVAVPFLWLGFDYDPWMLFDGFAFVFTAMATFVVAGRLFGRVAAGVAGFGLSRSFS